MSIIAKHYIPYRDAGNFVTVSRCRACESIAQEYDQMMSGAPCPNCGSSKVFELKNPAVYRNGRWEVSTPEKRESRRQRMTQSALLKMRVAYDEKIIPVIKKYCPFLEFDKKIDGE